MSNSNDVQLADAASTGNGTGPRIVPVEKVLSRYEGDWWRFYPTEFLLPQIRKHIELREFSYIANRKTNPKWTDEAIKDAIREYGHWEYFFEFNNGLTTRVNSTFNDRTIDFHQFRSELIPATVVDLLGDAASQSTVLDLACHCGCFTMDLATRGVGQAHGIEFREKNLRQARFLREYYDIANASFEQGDVYEIPDKSYDVVMCLGLLYHVVRPVDVVEYCYRNARKFAVIETICHKQPFSGYVVIGDKNVNVAIEGTRPIELQPTYRGLIDTMKQVGFKNIVEVVGTCDKRIDIFGDNSRRCLIGFK